MCEEGGSENRTSFNPDDASSGQEERFEQLRETNRGYWRGHADTANQAAQDRRQRYEAIASQLDLTDAQQTRGWRRLQSVDLQRMGLSLDLVVFCLCALVVRDDGREFHPHRSNENNDELFVEMAERLDFRESLMASCWEKLRRQEFE